MSKLDANALRSSELLRLLNGAGLGTVTSDRQLRARLDAAGTRVAGSKAGRVSLARFVAHTLAERRQRIIAKSQRPPAEPNSAESYERKKERERQRAREAVQKTQDIAKAFERGRMPAAEDADRRESCRFDFKRFMGTYTDPEWKPFSDMHQRGFARMTRLGLDGGKLARLWPRNYVKTTAAELWAGWGAAYGHFQLTELVFSGDEFAERSLRAIRALFEQPDAPFARDFPEIHLPIVALDNRRNRCKGQKWDGRSTGIDIADDQLILPVVPGAGKSWDDGPYGDVVADSAGRCILTLGIDSRRVHGAKVASPRDGRTHRPTAIIIDDVVTDGDAWSASRNRKKLAIIKNGLARSRSIHGKFTMIFNGTCFAPGDVGDVLADPKQSPDWASERVSALKTWPKAKDMWDEFGEMLRDFEPNTDDDDERSQQSARRRANSYYASNRAAMDEGAEVTWEHAYSEAEGEISALHSLMLVYYGAGAEVFACACQNKPLDPAAREGEARPLSPPELATRLNNLPRGEVPGACIKITGFVDIQDNVLFWLVTAWRNDFTGYVVNLGTFPEQARPYFVVRDFAEPDERRRVKTIADAYVEANKRAPAAPDAPVAGDYAMMRWAFEQVAERLCGREWLRDDGVALRLSRLLYDANDGDHRNAVFDFCRQSVYAGTVQPALGEGVGAKQKPFPLRDARPGEQQGDHWFMPTPLERAILYVRSDVNYWKTFVRNRLRTPVGDPGALTIFGKDAQAHALLFDHLCAERSQVMTGPRYGKVQEWEKRPNSENHWWDCLVGCAIGASMEKIALPGAGEGVQARRNAGSGVKTWAEAKAARRGVHY